MVLANPRKRVHGVRSEAKKLGEVYAESRKQLSNAIKQAVILIFWNGSVEREINKIFPFLFPSLGANFIRYVCFVSLIELKLTVE